MERNSKSIFFVPVLLIFGVISFYFAREVKAPKVENLATVVFSSNLAGTGDCHDNFTDGCDIFTAQVDLTNGEVTKVEQITKDSTADIFPVLSQDKKYVFYTKSSEDQDTAMKISIAGDIEEVLSSSANSPFPTFDGKEIFLTLTKGHYLAKLSDEKSIVEKIKSVNSAYEVHVSAKGLIAFYRLISGKDRGSRTAQAMIYIPETDKTIEVTEADGTAHCFWNFDGSILYCNNRDKGGILSYPISSDGLVGDSNLAIPFPKVEVLGAIDPAFDQSCVSTSLEYGSFCNANQVLLTASCYVKNEGGLDQKFTQIVILDISTGKFLPLGANIAKAYDETGGTSWTGTCVE